VPPAQRAKSLLTAGKEALARDDVLAARAHFSEAMSLGVTGEQALYLQTELTRLGNATVFSPRMFENDPHVTRYVVKSGDTLGKIATAHLVSAELLAETNGIRDQHLIRVGQVMKVVRGPFRAVVDRKTYSLDVHLGNTFVRHYKVGLGVDGSTPAGEWRVSTKLKNPTYYPPRGGKIMASDDPENPLGERWIGLEGISGEALGQLRYGIHGTIDPDSIGRNASLGCIRMYNEDVEALYTFLVEKHSTVTVN